MNNPDNIHIDLNHSKQNILEIIKHSNMDISQPYLYTKESLFEVLVSYISSCNHEISFYDPQYPFSNRKEFIEWLGRAPEKLSGADKMKIHNTAKEIILYCKSGYDLKKTKYNNYDEVYEDILKIKDYGTISYVRTAVKLFNLTRDVNEQIDCKVPYFIHNQLMLKKRYKEKCIPVLQVKYGKFKLDFS